MRIISGKFKGKKLFLPQDKNTRPLKDLVKESIFNLLEHSSQIKKKIEDASVLDLFCGSGSNPNPSKMKDMSSLVGAFSGMLFNGWQFWLDG